MTNFHSSKTKFINKIKLRVKDLETQKTFYTDFLGLSTLSEENGLVTLSADGKTPLIELEEKKDAIVMQPAYGLYHFALLFESETALADVFLNLIEKRYGFDGFSDHGVSKAIYLRDPENNGIELYVDRPANEWQYENGVLKMVTDPLNYQNLLLAASGEKFEKIAPGTIMGHLHFYVDNIKKGKAFFIDVLGFDLILDYGQAASFVSDKGYHHHIGFNTWLQGANHRQPNHTGLVEYYLNVTDEEKVKILARAKESGVVHLQEDGKDVLVDINNIKVVL